MTKSSKSDYAHIDIHEVLTQRRQVAVIWCIEDVMGMRPDLSGDQAWEVLEECRDQHDCEYGFTWLLIEVIADLLFPRSKDNQTAKEGVRP
jgi:hypothetical protein